MDVTADELAGVIDLFGALTPAELHQAIEEIAFKRGEKAPEIPIETAVMEYRLVAVERDDGDGPSVVGQAPGTDGSTVDDSESGERFFVPGPTAFPTLPPGAEDLPHILAIETRTVDHEALSERVEARFRADAARAVLEEDDDRIAELLDASYDLEAWGAVDLGDARERLDATVSQSE